MPVHCCLRATKTAALGLDELDLRRVRANRLRELPAAAAVKVVKHLHHVDHVVQLPCRLILMDYHNGLLRFQLFPHASTRIYRQASMEPCFTWKRDADQARQMNSSATACAIGV